MKIGIFDSGIGGITVLKELLTFLPDEHYVYYSDSKNNPYGSKTHAEIEALSLAAANFLLDKGCEIIVIACNTASAEAVEFLRTRFKDVPIFAIQPAIKQVYDSSDSENYTIAMATAATLGSNKFQELVNNYPVKNLITLDCNGLAELIEAGNEAGIKTFLEEKLAPYKGQAKNVVLGCTHYPLVSKNIREILGSDTKFFNGAKGLARNLAEFVDDKKSPAGSGEIEFFDSSNNPVKEKRFWEIIR